MSASRGRSGRWTALVAYWVLQGACCYAAWPALAVGSWSDYLTDLTNQTYVIWAIGAITALSALQVLFVFPVRRPAPAMERGWPIWLSLSVAGFLLVAMGGGFVLAIKGILELVGRGSHWWITDSALGLGVTLAAMWLVATPLLIAFCRRGPRESLLARVAALIFTGTLVEVAAIIPIDVMIRRRDKCYCFAETYVALLVCGTVGVFMLGPAVFLPLLARRRKRWYHGRCEVCGYDMSGTMGAERCPECGTGWRPPAGQSGPTVSTRC